MLHLEAHPKQNGIENLSDRLQKISLFLLTLLFRFQLKRICKSQYQKIRNNGSKENYSTLFPSCKKVHEAKLICYPTKSDLTITECSAEVKLQALLDHTIKRILSSQADVIDTMPQENVRNLNLICEWGCDGTFGQNTFKQKFADDDGSKSDANIFFYFTRFIAAFISRSRYTKYSYTMEKSKAIISPFLSTNQDSILCTKIRKPLLTKWNL